MSPKLPFHDIQGNIARGYRLKEFTQLFCTIGSNVRGWKGFLHDLAGVVTHDELSIKTHGSAINVGISYAGLKKLHPRLAPELDDSFPAFAAGMARRAATLGDPDDIDWALWSKRDVWIAFYGEDRDRVTKRIDDVRRIAEKHGVELDESLPFSGPAYRDGTAIGEGKDRFEHFGFKDGTSNPVFDGARDESRLQGNGKRNDANGWSPIATGEILLGYPNEQGQDVVRELPSALQPFFRNGTFAVLRVLEQHVREFHEYIERKERELAHLGLGGPSLAERMIGRTKDGKALAAPERGDDFDYRIDDPKAAKCPFGAHVRLANPRISGEHRVLRRSVPFGAPFDRKNPTDEPRGIYFIALNASIENQFEFLQKTYLNGEAAGHQNGGKVQEARDPLAATGTGFRRMVIEGDVESGRRPLLLLDIPRFVTCRGGQYYLVPSISGLRAIAGTDVAEWPRRVAPALGDRP